MTDDGLSKRWMNPTYVNPPYGKGIYKWVEKTFNESKKGNLVVMLIPSRTDTRYFHDFIYNKQVLNNPYSVIIRKFKGSR